MEQNQALNVLVQAVRVAQKRGTYNLDEASTVAAAVSTFVVQSEVEKTAEAEEITENLSEVPDEEANE